MNLETKKDLKMRVSVVTAIAGIVVAGLLYINKYEKEPQKEVVVPRSTETQQNIPPVDGSVPLSDTDGRRIKVLTLTNENTVEFFSEVSHPSSLQAIKEIKEKQLNPDVERLYFLITSPGGSVFSGLMVLEAIEGSPVPVDTICVGFCASMGAHMHQIGKNRYMTNKSTLMFHPASGGVQGEVETMRSQILYIDRLVSKLDEQIAKRANIPLTEFKRRLRSEYWLDSEDATDLGFNDEIVYLQDERVPEKSLPMGIFGKTKHPSEKFIQLK